MEDPIGIALRGWMGPVKHAKGRRGGIGSTDDRISIVDSRVLKQRLLPALANEMA